jgi:hypothetical protein
MRSTIPRSLKHEDIYLKGYADGPEAKVGISAIQPVAKEINESQNCRCMLAHSIHATNQVEEMVVVVPDTKLSA